MAQYLNQLLAGLSRSQAVAVRDDAAFEQTAIAAQQNPFLTAGKMGHFLIGVIIAVERVKAKQAQVNCQLAQVDIQHQTGFVQRLRAQAD